MTSQSLIAALALVVVSALPGSCHEFWVEPTAYHVAPGAPLVADLRNGQEFKGSALSYFSKQTARFDMIQGTVTTPVTARMGDVPALSATAPGEGLLVIVHQTSPSTLKYSTWEKFQKFADHKDFTDMRARHDARGLPPEGFTETYTRFAKSLVGVGSSVGRDTATGMETEFVALTNPYTDDLSGGVAVQVLYRGAPRADAQVEVFDRAPDKTVTITLVRTDAAGRASIPVAPGHTYLLDAVVLRPAPDGGVPVWETLWAALTFAVPD